MRILGLWVRTSTTSAIRAGQMTTDASAIPRCRSEAAGPDSNIETPPDQPRRLFGPHTSEKRRHNLVAPIAADPCAQAVYADGAATTREKGGLALHGAAPVLDIHHNNRSSGCPGAPRSRKVRSANQRDQIRRVDRSRLHSNNDLVRRWLARRHLGERCLMLTGSRHLKPKPRIPITTSSPIRRLAKTLSGL